MSSSELPDTTTLKSSISSAPSREGQSGRVAQALAWACLAFVVACSLLIPDFSYGKAIAVARGFSVWQIGFTLFAFFFAALYAGANWNVSRSHRLSVIWLIVAMVVAWHGMATSWSIGRSNVKFAIAGFWHSTAFWLLLPTVAWLVQTPRGAARVLNLLWIVTVFVFASGLWDSRLGERFGHAGFLVAVWPLLLGWFLQTLSGDRDGSLGATTTRTPKWIWIVPFVLLIGTAFCLLCNTSVTAWLAAAIATLFALILDPLLRADIFRFFKQRPVGAIAMVLAALAVVVIQYFLDPRFLYGVDQSLAKSSGYWKGTLDLIGTQPWLGFGSLNFQSSYLQLESFTGMRPPTNPRNFLLELAHAGGWPLMGLSLLLIGVVALRGCCRRSFAPSGNAASQENSTDHGGEGLRSLAAIFFWGAACLSVIVFIVYATFYGGGELQGGHPIALGAAIVFGFWLNRNQALTTSVQGFVQNHSILLWVAFLGTFSHFLVFEGWMAPAEMIGAILALGLWIAARNGTDASSEPVASAGKEKGSRRFVGAIIAVILVGLWSWSMAVPLARSNQVWFSMVAAAKADEKAQMSPDAYGSAIESVRFDPDLPELGMGYCVGMLARDIPEGTKERWLHQFQQSRIALIERDPSNALAYASAGKQSIRACVSLIGGTASSQDMVSPGGGGGRRGQPGRGRRGPAMSPVASRMLSESLGYYREAANRAPGNSEIHFQAAVAAALAGNWKACQSLFEQAEKIEAENANSKRSQHEVLVWIPNALIPVMESQAKRGRKLTDEKNEAWESLVQHVAQNEMVAGDLIRNVFSNLLKSNE